jgi:hypothetical protein
VLQEYPLNKLKEKMEPQACQQASIQDILLLKIDIVVVRMFTVVYCAFGLV